MKHSEPDHRDPRNQDTYQTGSTKPPKSRGSLVAVLLILVIFLAGLSSFLGVMNIHLFSALKAQNGTIPVSLSDHTPTLFRCTPDSQADPSTGIAISCEPVSAQCQNYYHLPAGLYINAVTEDSDAALQGLVPGDILTSLNGNPITSNEDLTEFLGNCQAGEAVEAVIYRNRGYHTLKLTIEAAKD